MILVAEPEPWAVPCCAAIKYWFVDRHAKVCFPCSSENAGILMLSVSFGMCDPAGGGLCRRNTGECHRRSEMVSVWAKKGIDVTES